MMTIRPGVLYHCLALILFGSVLMAQIEKRRKKEE